LGLFKKNARFIRLILIIEVVDILLLLVSQVG